MKPLRKCYTDSNYPLNFEYKDAAKQPIPLTGASARLVIRKSLHSPILIDKTATIDELNGKIAFVITPTDTQNILGEDDSGTYLLGAVLTLASGEVVVLAQTELEIHKNIVRSA